MKNKVIQPCDLMDVSTIAALDAPINDRQFSITRFCELCGNVASPLDVLCAADRREHPKYMSQFPDTSTHARWSDADMDAVLENLRTKFEQAANLARAAQRGEIEARYNAGRAVAYESAEMILSETLSKFRNK